MFVCVCVCVCVSMKVRSLNFFIHYVCRVCRDRCKTGFKKFFGRSMVRPHRPEVEKLTIFRKIIGTTIVKLPRSPIRCSIGIELSFQTNVTRLRSSQKCCIYGNFSEKLWVPRHYFFKKTQKSCRRFFSHFHSLYLGSRCVYWHIWYIRKKSGKINFWPKNGEIYEKSGFYPKIQAKRAFYTAL